MRKYQIVLLFMLLNSIGAWSQTYSITDFGAVPDGKTLNTSAIQKAINVCTEKGGTVYVPAGVFVTGTIELKSNVNLYLETGAVIKGSPNLADYRPYQSPVYDSPAQYGIVYAHKAHNVSITGQGAIDGNEEAYFIWDKAKKIDWGGTKYTRQKENFRKVLSGIDDGPVEPKERPRQMVIFSECTNVSLKDIQLLKSPFWTLHFADCDGVIAQGLKIRGSLAVPNNDGMDITSCNNVLVSNCDIRTGDDAIVVTGYAHHFELPGYENLIHESANINITNCNLQSRSSGIRIGFLDQNTVRNINICNVNITNSNRGIGIFVRDSGSIENVTISQVNIETRLHTGDWWGNGEPIHISAVRGTEKGRLGQVRNVIFRDITCRSENGILLYGSAESQLEGIQFENVRLTIIPGKLNEIAGGNIDLRGAYGDKQLFESDLPAILAIHSKNLTIKDLTVNWENVKDDFFKNAIQVQNFSGFRMDDIKITSVLDNPKLKRIVIENGSGLSTNLSESEYELKNVKK